MESGDDGLESEANVRTRPCLTGAGSPGAQSTATDRGPSRQARLNRSAEGARTAYSARHTCPKTPETQSRNRSVRQAARIPARPGAQKVGRVLRFGHRQFSYNFTQGFSAPGVNRVYFPERHGVEHVRYGIGGGL